MSKTKAPASRPSKAPTKASAQRKPAAVPRSTAKAGASASRSTKPAAKKPAAHKPTTAPRAAVKVQATSAKTSKKPETRVAGKAATQKSDDKAHDKMTTKTTIQTPAPKPVEKMSRSASKAAARIEPPPAPDMSRLVGSSRFADRFAPPKPPTRQMNNPVIDIPRVVAKPDPKLVNAWKTKSGREMSEAEILAMPDTEYMSEKQLDFFRGKLLTLKEDLLSNAGETTEHLREDTSIVPDPADRATIEEEHALELRTRDRERKLLKKITQSLARLDSGEYGYCDETGEPIGLGRLIARPTANLSLEAQQRREMKQKMFGD